VLLLAVVLLLAACGSDDSDESGSTGATGTTTDVSLVDFSIEPSHVTVSSAGTTTFAVVNNGQTTHALEIEGNGIEEETDELQPGDSADLTVDLKEGTYEIYCPVDGHRAQGMEGTLTVGSGMAGSTSGGTDTGDDNQDPYGG